MGEHAVQFGRGAFFLAMLRSYSYYGPAATVSGGTVKVPNHFRCLLASSASLCAGLWAEASESNTVGSKGPKIACAVEWIHPILRVLLERGCLHFGVVYTSGLYEKDLCHRGPLLCLDWNKTHGPTKYVPHLAAYEIY